MLIAGYRRFMLPEEGAVTGAGQGQAEANPDVKPDENPVQDPVANQEEPREEPKAKPAVPSWMSQISKDRRERLGERLSRYKSLNDVVDRMEYLSDNGIVMPTEGSSDEEVAKWRRKHDIPVGDETYNLTDDESLYKSAEGVVDNDRKASIDLMRNQVLQLGKDADLSRSQLQKVWNSRLAMLKAAGQAAEKQRKDMEGTFAMRMDNAYRADYPDESARDAAQQADINRISGVLSGMPKFRDFLQKSGALLDPSLIREFATYIRRSGSGTVQGSQVGGTRQHEGMLIDFNDAFYRQFEK